MYKHQRSYHISIAYTAVLTVIPKEYKCQGNREGKLLAITDFCHSNGKAMSNLIQRDLKKQLTMSISFCQA